ncbi:hypothetical protein [Pedobacter insulae]|uniref:Outer membrane protein beta-barrel domain-containing protein n=1 Tax=Pedobacter insulae TaxID=414048 RepID=A0A1I2WZK9_9SPHI|nr:hypothetical protein [Pedobacter insulae]SFH05886.1 hypothetical protein SAMN04489864_104353 [Pedobacter insulae]
MLKKIILGGLLILNITGYGQTINWNRLERTDRHMLSINAGLDYGLTGGLAYGYKLKTETPVVLTAEYSTPFGEVLIDDYKSKIGVMLRFAEFGDFSFSAKLQGLFRRYESEYVRMSNFGTEISVTSGYYKKNWYIAAEAGFDKAIITHFKHAEIYRENFPLVKDGWYEPSSGGNFNYGLQAGFSVDKSDITLRIGWVITQDFKTVPNLPFYAQLGYAIKLRNKN